VTRKTGSRAFAVALLFVSGCSPAGRTPVGDIAISMQPAGSSRPAFVRVGGLSSEEAVEPRSLTVTVKGAEVPVVGRAVVNGAALEFHPAFPFDAGRSYVVRLDTSRWRAPRTPAVSEAVVSLPAPAETARVTVSAIRPSQDRWPENTLRFYVHFSAPMSQASGVGKVHLVGEDGEDIPNALLPLNVDLWNDDRTRYTVLFDPARVKRGILSNREMGRALVTGRRYAIVVDADWLDANGRPLASTYRHEFTAGPPLERALDTRTWRVAPPDAGTREAIVVTFPFPLDAALLHRAIEVASAAPKPQAARGAQETLKGTIEVGADAMSWRFVPDVPWQQGSYRLNVASILEDPAGNRIGRPFEIDPKAAVAEQDPSPVIFIVSAR
jgi:hypothetical protein